MISLPIWLFVLLNIPLGLTILLVLMYLASRIIEKIYDIKYKKFGNRR